MKYFSQKDIAHTIIDLALGYYQKTAASFSAKSLSRDKFSILIIITMGL
ncbi:MAG: hypothetical protein MJK08_08635 [Campylobacterales bacterium]|nr:hypothetical protein [Campylobacterales bacterium]NQY54621.1 hypothetical protein [Campylobacteraceae bacterium]